MYIRQDLIKESEVTRQGRREIEVGTLLLGNDRNNVVDQALTNCVHTYVTYSKPKILQIAVFEYF